MSRQEKETSYLNKSHMDLLSISEEECAMVVQDNPSSEDLDDSIVIGQQNSEKDNFEKIHYESLFEQQSSSEEEMTYNNPGRTANEPPDIGEDLEKGYLQRTKHVA